MTRFSKGIVNGRTHHHQYESFVVFLKMLFKITNIFLCLLFIMSAILQYNDPDPYLWIPIYLYGAILCALAARNRFYPTAYIIGIVVYGVYAGYKFFTKDGVLDWLKEHHAENIAATMKAGRPWIEETREFFGLVLLIIALLMDYFYANKRSRSTLRTTKDTT